jgi:hypothetical protein
LNLIDFEELSLEHKRVLDSDPMRACLTYGSMLLKNADDDHHHDYTEMTMKFLKSLEGFALKVASDDSTHLAPAILY